VTADPLLFLQIQEPDETELIVGAFSQGASSGAESFEMNEISFPLLDERRCSIFLSGSGKEDFFEHDWASKLVEAQSSAMNVILGRSRSLPGA
jgi:hypothetical protein